MNRMHTLTPRGVPHRAGRNQLHFDAVCMHCFVSLGVSATVAERVRREKLHVCAEKLLARQPATPMPFN